MLMSPGKMVEAIKMLGPEHCVLGTDFGQEFNPPPTEGFHMMLAQLLMFGLSEDELSIMVKVNPAKLLGLAS
jgi:microsomal dipeptidase-like Zn-dependent dipeptidase